jgi:phage terminase large subunit-like protein
VRAALFARLTKDELILTLDNWRFWLRDEQLAPEGDWRIWLFLGGRGAGKTMAGAHFVEEGIRLGHMRRVGVIGATFNDARAVMIEGESGLMKLCEDATFEPSNRRLLWPSGAVVTVLSADEPDSLRGHQFDALWLDGDRAPKKSSH